MLRSVKWCPYIFPLDKAAAVCAWTTHQSHQGLFYSAVSNISINAKYKSVACFQQTYITYKQTPPTLTPFLVHLNPDLITKHLYAKLSLQT